MRLLKRALLFTAEIGVLVFGFLFALALAVRFDSSDNNLAPIAFFSVLLLTLVSLLILRRKTRRRKIEWAAAGWTANRSRRQRHPRRARYLRTTRRCLLWLPSAFAALTVISLPLASHIFYSGTHLVPHYQFSLPLNWTIVKSRGDIPNSFVSGFFSNEGASRYGLTPIWFNHSLPSGVTLGITGPASAYAWRRPQVEIEQGRPTHIAKTEFTMGAVVVNCWEYQDTFDAIGSGPNFLYPRELSEVLCSTQPNGRDFNLHASFLGQKEDVPVFYRVLRGATPIN
jgi:hypothetical protein